MYGGDNRNGSDINADPDPDGDSDPTLGCIVNGRSIVNSPVLQKSAKST